MFLFVVCLLGGGGGEGGEGVFCLFCFVATGSFQEVIGDVFGVSRMTMHRCILRVSAALKRAICR